MSGNVTSIDPDVLSGTIEAGDGVLIGNLSESAIRGYSIQYVWDGTRLGIKTENQAEYQYVDLRGGPGDVGRTAYSYAQDGGFAGTESEFSESLASIGNINAVLSNLVAGGEVVANDG